MKQCRFITVAIAAMLCMLQVRAAAAAPFEKEIEAFEKSDRTNPPPRNAVLFVGSSTIRFWTTLAADFPGIPVINRGFGGSQISDSLRYADRIILPYHPRQIVLYAGDNDLAAGKSPERVLHDFQALVEKIRAARPDVPIDFLSIKPSIARWKLIDQIRKANRLVREYAATQKNVRYIDIFTCMLGPDGKPRKDMLKPDGLHPSRHAYEVWAGIIRPELQ